MVYDQAPKSEQATTFIPVRAVRAAKTVGIHANAAVVAAFQRLVADQL